MAHIIPELRARQASEVAVVTTFGATLFTAGETTWECRHDFRRRSQRFNTREQAIQSALDHGYTLVLGYNGEELARQSWRDSHDRRSRRRG